MLESRCKAQLLQRKSFDFILLLRGCYLSLHKISCGSISQPSLDTLVEVSKALVVDVRELLVSNKEEPKYIRVE